MVDCIDDIMLCLYMFNVQTLRPEAAEFVDLIGKITTALYRVAEEFPNYKKSAVLAKHLIEVNRLESLGDELYCRSIRSLYESGQNNNNIVLITDKLIVDMSRVTFMDSSELGLIMGRMKSAEELIISENLGLVRSIAFRFRGRGCEDEDLMQIGTMGLLRAARSFDVSRGVVFSTYAVPLIIGEIKRFLRDDGMIKVGRARKQHFSSMDIKHCFTSLTTN